MPIRKLSISRKGSSNDMRALNGSLRGDKPPVSIGSRASSTVGDDVDGQASGSSSPRRKQSLAVKSKRRLSAIFNSGSQHSKADRSREESPVLASSGANGASGASTPTLDTVASKYSTLDSKGLPSVPSVTSETSDALSSGIKGLNVDASTPQPIALPVASAPVSLSPEPTLVDSPDRTRPISTLSTPQRAARVHSLYTQWAEYSDSESEDDGAGYATPSEGLSDLEEEDEDEEGTGTAASKANGNGSATKSTRLKLYRSEAGAAKVTHQPFKRGDPLAINQTAALAPDLDVCRAVITLFLSSKMREAEDLLVAKDADNNHLYLQMGHSLIQCLKGMMTFDSEDLTTALDIAKATSLTATTLRRPTESVLSKIGGLVRSGHGVARVRQMSALERHAELVYAETVLIKAMVAIVAGGDWLGLIKEALNMRTAHGIYRNLQQYLDESDKDGYDDDIDMDFRSGVLLGTGTSSLMLSLLPGKVLKLAEVFGYAGDRTIALKTLMSAGGWSDDSELPAFNQTNEGIRRPVCDMILLTFHLVISVLMPVSGVDIPAARKILAYNMKRYPDGVFFLYFQARLFTNQCEPELSNESLQHALNLPLEYVQLQHMCLWDYGCNYLQLNNWDGARQCFEILRAESNWSRAVYTYATAVSIMELISCEEHPEATPEAVVELVQLIPKLTKKIAGKSLPIEKLVARKSRKFASQGNRLFLPAMELAYVFGSLGFTPRRVLLSKWLPHINAELAKLEASTPEAWGSGVEYWDDAVLGHFLRAMVQFISRYQPADAADSARVHQPGEPSDEDLDAGAERDFQFVIDHSTDVRLDHYILFHNHYEMGRLYARRGDKANARIHFDVVMNNKLPVPNPHIGKTAGKYSLEGALQIKTHAAMQGLKESA